MQGKCYYCGKELTERTIKRHMKNCSEMKKVIEEKMENTKGIREQFLISIKDKQASRKYCVYVSIDAGLQLAHLDKFIRDIWVECCGHLSTFYIDREEYSHNSDGQYKMNFLLKDILSIDKKFQYKYDFDLTTHLILEVVDIIKVSEEFSQIEIIARNNEEILEQAYCNSPRDGVCGYSGSKEAEIPYLPQNFKEYMINREKPSLSNEEECDHNDFSYDQHNMDKLTKDSYEEINKSDKKLMNLFLKGKYSLDLEELIESYPKKQISILAENINLKLPSSLNKPKAIEKYINEYEECIKSIMLTLNHDMYNILYKCVKNNGIIYVLDDDCDWNENQYSFLTSKGMIFPSTENEKPIFIMPQVMQNIVTQNDNIEFRRLIKKNSEILNIFRGMIEAYGFLYADDAIELIKRYVIDIDESMLLSILKQSVLYNIDYYGNIDENGKIIFINEKIDNYKEILNEIDEALDYTVLNKQELISMAQEDYLKKSSIGKKFMKEFSAMFVMNKDDIIENMEMMALEIQYANGEDILRDIIDGIDGEHDIYVEAKVRNIINRLIKNIPIWKYKGATINEKEGSNKPVVSENKVGRNDSCPCGSGKKFKKCCG